MLKHRRQPERGSQIVVVKDENAGKFPDRLFEIGHGARKTGGQFCGRHIVSPLGDTHGNAFFGAVGIGYGNEAQHHGITFLGCPFQKSQLVTHRIGKHRLENKTLAQINKFLPQFRGDLRRLIRVNSQFPGQNIRVEKTQAAGLQMSFVKRGFPRAIRPGYNEDHRTLVQIGKAPQV